MKKLVFIVLLLLVAFLSGIYYQFKETHSAKTAEQCFNNNIDTLQKELDNYKKKEQEEKIRKIQLQALQNPEIIITKFKEIGKLKVYEGQWQYSDILREKNWYSSKEVDLKLLFNYGIAIDLQTVLQSNIKITGENVIIKIPKKEVKLDYIELDTENTTVTSTKTWLASQYKPEDIRMIFNQARNKTREEIGSNKEVFNKSIDSLKNNLRLVVLALNYKEVIFEEV
jgi:hypothetical protein